EIGLDVEPHDKEPFGGESLCDVRSEVNPAAIPAGDDHRRSATRAVQAERLCMATNDDHFSRLGARTTARAQHTCNRQGDEPGPVVCEACEHATPWTFG